MAGTDSADASTPAPEVSPAEAVTLSESGAHLLDVREDGEWRAGHAPSARHLPMGEIGARLAEVPKDRVVVCVCRVGARSAAVAAALAGAGFDARNLAGGMQAWASEGLPVVTDDGGAGQVA